MRVFVVGLGVVSAAGADAEACWDALRRGVSRLAPLDLFPVAGGRPLPVGQAPTPVESDLPRTHALARQAAREAMASAAGPPDAVVVGGTTGGILTTEELLRRGAGDPALYCRHDVGTVAAAVASACGCRGPALSVSTACASGALAVQIALALLRAGRAGRVLAGGADSLSRLTYYGFASLQLTDPRGCRPLDRDRDGMNVAEGAAFLLLEAAAAPPAAALAEVAGGGLSCDAHHAASPDPDGKGAAAAMRAALADAGLRPDEIDYLNLHGTGARANDAAEGRAIRAVFPQPPALSSTKGIFGHALGAAGALEAAICVRAVADDFTPANVGFANADPDVGLTPIIAPTRRPVRAAMTNSLGFGGNNACLVFRKPAAAAPDAAPREARPLTILGSACLTAKGELAATVAALARGEDCLGKLPTDRISRDLPPRFIRRLERLPLAVLNLAARAVEAAGAPRPQAIFFATGHGPLSETNHFLRKLFASGERFGSAIDFVGSVHNAPAGQAAMFLQATGANVVATGGDDSFEQVLMMAELLAADAGRPLLALGADEGHEELSPLFDASVRADSPLSDGGGALLLTPDAAGGPTIRLAFYQSVEDNPRAIPALIAELNRGRGCGALFAAMPAAARDLGERQLPQIQAGVQFDGPVFDVRRRLGEYPTVTATAAALAVEFIKQDRLPDFSGRGETRRLAGRCIAIVGLGRIVTCIEIRPENR